VKSCPPGKKKKKERIRRFRMSFVTQHLADSRTKQKSQHSKPCACSAPAWLQNLCKQDSRCSKNHWVEKQSCSRGPGNQRNGNREIPTREKVDTAMLHPARSLRTKPR